jgi:hypothetical protein
MAQKTIEDTEPRVQQLKKLKNRLQDGFIIQKISGGHPRKKF